MSRCLIPRSVPRVIRDVNQCKGQFLGIISMLRICSMSILDGFVRRTFLASFGPPFRILLCSVRPSTQLPRIYLHMPLHINIELMQYNQLMYKLVDERLACDLSELIYVAQIQIQGVDSILIIDYWEKKKVLTRVGLEPTLFRTSVLFYPIRNWKFPKTSL